MREPTQRQIRQIGDRTGRPSSGHQPRRNLAAPHRDHLEVDEFGSHQRFARQAFPGMSAVSPIIAQRHGQYARVNDDHVPPERDQRRR